MCGSQFMLLAPASLMQAPEQAAAVQLQPGMPSAGDPGGSPINEEDPVAASPRDMREAKRRIQQMEAKRELRREQEKRRRRDNLIAGGAGTAAVILAVVLQLAVYSGNPT